MGMGHELISNFISSGVLPTFWVLYNISMSIKRLWYIAKYESNFRLNKKYENVNKEESVIYYLRFFMGVDQNNYE